MTKRSLITAKRLREVLDYDPDTGSFTWKKLDTPNHMKVGDKAGYEGAKGYFYICVDARIYFSHRLAWFYMTGKWPLDQIDHINTSRKDNRFCNLREATNAQNRRNAKVQENNSSGHKGVCWHKRDKKWSSRIKLHGKYIWLGYFETIEDALKARIDAAKESYGEFFRIN